MRGDRFSVAQLDPPPSKFDDIDPKYGLHHYGCTVEVRTHDDVLFSDQFHDIDALPGFCKDSRGRRCVRLPVGNGRPSWARGLLGRQIRHRTYPWTAAVCCVPVPNATAHGFSPHRSSTSFRLRRVVASCAIDCCGGAQYPGTGTVIEGKLCTPWTSGVLRSDLMDALVIGTYLVCVLCCWSMGGRDPQHGIPPRALLFWPPRSISRGPLRMDAAAKRILGRELCLDPEPFPRRCHPVRRTPATHVDV